MLYPLERIYPITQTYKAHVARALANGWCPRPGICASGIYYYGGIDYAVPLGTPVLAADAGLVVKAAWDTSGYGNHVRIQHSDGYMTVYGHLSVIDVKVGDRVNAGDVVGRSGSTGYSTGPHLHFEVRKDGVPIDPEPLLTSAAPTQPEQKPSVAGEFVIVRPGWNLRAGPNISTTDLGTTDAPVNVELLEVQDDWCKVRFEVWVHRDAIER